MNQRLSQKEIKEFSARLADARSQAKISGQEAEKLVEGAYHDVFLRYFKRNYDTVKLTAPHQTDGLIEVGDVNLFAQIAIRLLIETKFDLRLSVSKGNRCKVIAQLIYYLKKFEQSGDSLPNVLLVGDVNNMFVLYTAAVAAYLQNDYDWTIAPSAAYKEEKLFGELLNDKNLSPYVYEIRSPHFDLHYVFSSIEQLAQNGGVIEKIKVGDEILLKAFLEFQRVVYKGIVAQTKEQMSVFVLSLLGDADVYLHPNKPNVLKVREKEIRLNGADYLTYFSRYDKSNYTLDEQKRITAIADRLIAELDRRFTGDYWTPVLWANEAHNLIGTELGADWRQKYVVWDCACGTKNLTRDYHDFAELYCSTLHPEELEIASDYNPKATTFQYDFLNDDIALHKYELAEVAIRGWKLPPALLRALIAKKPVVLFTNPPYGQPTNATAVTSGTGNKSRQIVGGGERGIADTEIGKLMRQENFGHATMELCTQFIYRAQLLAKTFGYEQDFHLLFYSVNFLISPNFSVFTEQFTRRFKFQQGFMFNAGEFHGTASTWGVLFSHFALQPRKKAVAAGKPLAGFAFTVKESFAEKLTGEIAVRNVGRQISKTVPKGGNIRDWLAEIKISAAAYRGGDYPRANGFNLPAGKQPCGVYREGALGYLQIIGGSVKKSGKDLFLQSTMNYADHGVTVTAANFARAMAAFATRKTLLPSLAEKKSLWAREKDVFRRPSEKFQQAADWQNFVNDCVVYGLFCAGANMTALRGFAYGGNGKKYDVKNEFFYLAKKDVEKLAAKNHFIESERDAAGDAESFVYSYLQSQKLSPVAAALLTCARDYTRAAFRFRGEYHAVHPEYHLLAWDAGWLQQYKMTQSQDALPAAKAALANDYADFKRRLRVLGDQILAAAEADEMI